MDEEDRWVVHAVKKLSTSELFGKASQVFFSFRRGDGCGSGGNDADVSAYIRTTCVEILTDFGELIELAEFGPYTRV